MSWENENRARNDVLSGRRDHTGNEDYQRAYRAADSSAATGAMAGGLFGAIAGLIAIIIAGVAAVVAMLLKYWVSGIISGWKKSPTVGLTVFAAPIALCALLVVVYKAQLHAAAVAHYVVMKQESDVIENSAGYLQLTRNISSPETKRVFYMRAELAGSRGKGQIAKESQILHWWTDNSLNNDSDFIGRLIQEECEAFNDTDDSMSHYNTRQCTMRGRESLSPSRFALVRLSQYIDKEKTYR